MDFSEPVTGFDETDLDLSASTAGGTLTGTVTGSGASYTVTVEGMTTTGDVVLDVPAGAAVDGAGNGNDASTSVDNAVTWVDDEDPAPDAIDPTVTVEQRLGQADPTTVAPVRFSITFSEPVVGFDVTDISVSEPSLETVFIDLTGKDLRE